MYQVEWLQSALNQLAKSWTQADSELRQAITAATFQIDKDLASDPLANSESRPGNRRTRFASPLGIICRIDGQIVTVMRVWVFRTK